MTTLTDILSRNPALPFADAMRQTPQPKQWHGEGDVLTHTRMMIHALDEIPEVESLSIDERKVLYAAAWLHDIGKIRQTREIAGQIESPGHSSVGSRMVREDLWRRYGLCGDKESMQLREAIALLVRYHSVPPHVIDSDDAALRLHRIAANSLLTPYFSVRLLCLLSRSDMMGRICSDREAMLDQIAMCEELAKEVGCFDRCFGFPSGYTMRSYLKGRGVWKNQMLYDDSWGTVYMMSGLPGTGKDTWIKSNLVDIPMVSLDEIRSQHKISPTENQGVVANLAKDQAKEYLRRHQPFVWNATNLTQSTRQPLVELFESYKARVHIVYLETDWQTLLERNSSREAMVPQPVMESMLGKLVLPEAHEAFKVDWIAV